MYSLVEEVGTGAVRSVVEGRVVIENRKRLSHSRRGRHGGWPGPRRMTGRGERPGAVIEETKPSSRKVTLRVKWS